MTTGRINQGTVSVSYLPGPKHRGASSFFFSFSLLSFFLLPPSLCFLSPLLPSFFPSHSRTCRTAHTRPAPKVLGDAGSAYSLECLRVSSSRPGSWRADCNMMRALCRMGPRPQAQGRDVAMMRRSAGRRTCPDLSHSSAFRVLR